MLTNILRFMLLPVSILYGLVIDLRTWCYNNGILRSYKYPVPVISIGNITAGGTGKTPFTIYLAETLKQKYKKIAVVSRGYGRKSSGLHLVSNGEKVVLTPEESGDEPYLIASRLPDIFVAVSEKRHLAIDYLLEDHHVDLVILDDAFQHHQINRDADIVLINIKESYHAKWMLPAGSLREFRHNLSRADLVVLTNTDTPDISAKAKLLGKMRAIYTSRVVPDQIIDPDLMVAGNIVKIRQEKVVAFAGIAHPENFKATLVKEGIEIKGFKAYADHNRYTLRQIKGLIRYCKEKKCNFLICTEKDLVKISGNGEIKKILQESGLKVYGIRINVVVSGEEEMLKKLGEILDKSIS